MMIGLLKSLNPQQMEAVTAPFGHLLILAGAGSGKTRVLIHRIAWLIEQGVSPYHIFAVTFTNKAAAEMRTRLESLVRVPIHSLWVGTFHGLANRLLRTHWQEAQLPETFQILDQDDQYRLVRRLQRDLNIDEERFPPKQMQWFINKQKEMGRRAEQVTDIDVNPFTSVAVDVYKSYESSCQQSGVIDFAELLLRSLQLLQNHTQIREHYQKRFQHILVDEFQDTNANQYQFLNVLSDKSNCLMAVGDDDQSIYSWRGAEIENIRRFEKEFQNVTVIRLEQNYRSTQTILSAANAVIDYNHNRFGKNLWTDGSVGDLITLYTGFNERDEAYYVARTIEGWVKKGKQYSDVAVLYRSNAQSRILEESLIDCQIPYQIYGGLKFFERAEIKDALAYLRLIVNRNDDAALERIINTPARGIGHATLIKIRLLSKEHGCSIWHAIIIVINEQLLSSRALSALKKFTYFIDRLEKKSEALHLSEQIECVLADTTLIDFYKKDKSEKGLSRLDNLEELINAATQFHSEEISLPPLSAFLSHVSLEAGESQAGTTEDSVNLMTLHAAKGLEFPIVIITGLEEGLFPHRMSMDAPNGLEEERRLCYVGMTRAREKLVLSYANSRRLYGVEKVTQPSRFIEEIPDEFLDPVQKTAKVTKSVSNTSSVEHLNSQPIVGLGLCVGQRVRHKKFGVGTIVHYAGNDDTRLQVKFDHYGIKWLLASYAKLETLI